MARRGFVLLGCVLAAILSARVKPCTACLPKRSGCLTRQRLVPTPRLLSAGRQAVKSEEPPQRRFRWGSAAGWYRALNMLKERYGEQYDASQMTWAWWSENIKDRCSTIDVTCQICDHRSKSTTLSSLNSGTTPGCFCNRGVPWSSREGRERCLLMLKERYGEQYDASQMTWTWWSESIKDRCSTIDVTCQICGHRSKSTTLSSLNSGTTPGCSCNGGVPWSSREGRERCLLMLKERYGERYDASQMTWAWWSESIKDSYSTIDVTCQICGHRSKSTILSSLSRGTTPGCFCNRGVPWSSREGHERCLLMLKERCGEQYDASQMTWAWWSESIKDSSSTVDVTCKICGHRSKRTTLSSLNSGTMPGCFCNGGVPWLSREGHERCLLMLKERYGERYDASQMTWAWWSEIIKDSYSTIDVTCKICGHRSKRTTLSSLNRGTTPGCSCNGGVPWSSREGRERCLLMLKERYGERYDASQMTWAWWSESIKDCYSTIDVTCQICGHRSKNTRLGSLSRGTTPGCFCNGGVPWSSREGHERCLLMLKERYDEQYDASQMTWAWWSESIKDRCSTIDVTCKICGHRSKSSSLNNLKIGQAPGCLCNKKTEAKLGRWLVSEFTDSIITLQVQGCTNPDTGRPLPFDFGLYHDSVLIELDGDIGHFGRGFGGDPEDGGVPRRDFHKEYWAMQRGKVVVRLLQTDVYRDCWPWEDFLNSAVRHATCSTEPCVITQAAKEYKRGIYRKLRSDLNCKEGYFLPSRIPYLKYGAVRP